MIRQRFVRFFQAVLCAPVLLAGQAHANDDEGMNFSLTAHAGARVGGTLDSNDNDGEFDMDDSSSRGLTLSIPWEADTELEFWYSKQGTEVDLSDVGASAATDLDLEFYHLGGTILFDPQKYAVPFFVFTLGATRYSSDEPGVGSDTFGSFSLGGGWQFFPEERIGLRLEGRVLGTYINDNSDVFCAVVPGTSGCVVALSGEMIWQWDVNAGVVFRF